MFAVAGALAVDCVRQGHPATVHILVDSLGQFVRKFLVPWLKRRGGWVSFCLSKILGKHEMHKKLTFEIQQRFAFASFVCVCRGGVGIWIWCTALCMTNMLIVHEAPSAFSRLSAVWDMGMLFAYSGFLLDDLMKSFCCKVDHSHAWFK